MIEGCYISVVTLIVSWVRVWLKQGGEEREGRSEERRVREGEERGNRRNEREERRNEHVVPT